MSISCEIPSKDCIVQECKHGYFYYIKNNCYICSLEHRITLLESQIKQAVSFDVVHLFRETVETWKKSFEILVNSLIERIEKLEKLFNIQSVHNNATTDSQKEVNSQISQLWHKVNELYQIKKNMDFKKPHKCPVCDGKGYCNNNFEGQVVSTNLNCDSCNGKGIVWC